MYSRADISLEGRMEILSRFWRYGDDYGFVSELAREWQTSRRFIYDLAERVKQALDWQKPGPKGTESASKQIEQLKERILELESECDQLRSELDFEKLDKEQRRGALLLELALSPVSEDKIARCIRAAFGQAPSAGWINEQIKRAGQAALELMQTEEVRAALREAALDELFNNNEPYLTIVDPHTLMMLLPEKAENRQGETWNKVLEKYPNLELAVTDQGKGLHKGVKLNSKEIVHQDDLFHFKRNLRREVRRLESSCYRQIEQVDRARLHINNPRLLDSARIQAIIEYEEKASALDRKLEAFDWMEVILEYLQESISVFDFRRQSLRSYQEGQAAISDVLDLLDQIKEIDLTPIINLIEQGREKLLIFLSVLEGRLKQIPTKWRIIEGSSQALFSAIARVWYWQERASLSEHCFRQYQTALVGLLYWHKRVENFAQVVEQTFAALDRVVRASSAVECLNSILRPYFSVKKHLSQSFLALIALYWNFHPLAQRGGKTPFELNGIDLGTKDWVELIQLQIRRMARQAQPA